jgi:hypothetical protein
VTAFPFGTWVHVELIYETSGGASLTVKTGVTQTSFALALASQATAGSYGIRAGIPYVAGNTSAVGVWTDNVTLASKP